MLLAQYIIDKFIKAAMAGAMLGQQMTAPPEPPRVENLSASTISVSCIKAEWDGEEGTDYELSITPTDDSTGYTENICIKFEGNSKSYITGLREGSEYEIVVKELDDNDKPIDIVNCTLTVRKTIQRIQCFEENHKTRLVISEPKSTNSLRTIPIPECIMPMLKQFAGNPNAYILSGSCKPVEPRTMQNRFKKILNNANLPSINYHSLRHAFATGALEIGFDIKTLSEILGHSSVEVTLSRYIHSSMDRKRSCMNLLSLSA